MNKTDDYYKLFYQSKTEEKIKLKFYSNKD